MKFNIENVINNAIIRFMKENVAYFKYIEHHIKFCDKFRNVPICLRDKNALNEIKRFGLTTVKDFFLYLDLLYVDNIDDEQFFSKIDHDFIKFYYENKLHSNLIKPFIKKSKKK